jgi:hypothetical protein
VEGVNPEHNAVVAVTRPGKPANRSRTSAPELAETAVAAAAG